MGWTKFPALTKRSMKVLEQSAFAIQCDINGFLKHENICLLCMLQSYTQIHT